LVTVIAFVFHAGGEVASATLLTNEIARPNSDTFFIWFSPVEAGIAATACP
jgi:hypothetical protein